ncbi:MAG: phosphomannomutase/phosphoglucomutase [Rhodospirillales bacterium]|nr:phosphomannomutase/phosphoglucomutase [Rhodospirillales bacterium]
MTAAVRLDPTVLREYDIRGIIGKTLTAEHYEAIGRAFGTGMIREGGRAVAVGYDGRLTSPELEQALVAGLASTGLLVHRIGLGPSPMLYFAVHKLDADGGMMITGSHNPAEYNGIKMSRRGRPFFGDDIRGLGAAVEQDDYVSGQGQVKDSPVSEAYVERLCTGMSEGRPLRVAWDPGNGAAGDVLKALCARLPGEHVLINEAIDGTFPAHHPDPTVEENLVQLQAEVARHGCDLGIAFDGDGDRIGVIDDRGRVLWGDQLLVLLAGPVLEELPGATIIADVKSSQVFFDEIRRMGGKPLMSRTGHSPIKKLMAETGAPLAGEMSGHVFFAHRYYGYDDALYAAVRLLALVAAGDRSLAALRDSLPVMVNTPELRIDCPEERKFKVIEDVRARLAGVAGIAVNDVDGVRVTGADGWWLLRASNTQPVLVGRCEAADAAGLKRLQEDLDRQLRLSGLEPPRYAGGH